MQVQAERMNAFHACMHAAISPDTSTSTSSPRDASMISDRQDDGCRCELGKETDLVSSKL